MTSLRSLKCLKATVQLTFTTQKTNACSPWDYLFCFQVEIPFLGKFGPKFKMISLSWNFGPRLIQICRIPWRCSLFLLSTGNTFLGIFGPKNQNRQFELKFCARLIWICRIMQKICGVHFFCFKPEKKKKNQNCQLKQKFGIKGLIWIYGIRWWCRLFQFLTRDTFLYKFDPKNKIVSLSRNFALD